MRIDIETIDDVLPHLKDGNGIIVSERNEYTVIDYLYALKETFDSDMALQCRGLKFDKSGKIIARPFHKFFNLGEREDPLHMDWSRDHVVMDKLDGSMIHPAFVSGELVFMTRMGVTDHAKAALSHASEALLKLCRDQLADGWTPMFEYTGPDNRVVVAYAEPCLTLLAVREMVTGVYRDHEALIALGTEYGVPVVGTVDAVMDIKQFIAEGRALQDVEGYVIAFEDGHRVKLKADAYVLRHRAVSGLHSEKTVLNWVVHNAVDDVIPLLAPDAAERVLDFQKDVEAGISARMVIVESFCDAHRNMERRDFAMAARETLDKPLCAAAFAILDGRNPRQAVKQHLEWAAHSGPRIETVRDLYGFKWSVEGLPEIDAG